MTNLVNVLTERESGECTVLLLGANGYSSVSLVGAGLFVVLGVADCVSHHAVVGMYIIQKNIFTQYLL